MLLCPNPCLPPNSTALPLPNQLRSIHPASQLGRLSVPLRHAESDGQPPGARFGRCCGRGRFSPLFVRCRRRPPAIDGAARPGFAAHNALGGRVCSSPVSPQGGEDRKIDERKGRGLWHGPMILPHKRNPGARGHRATRVFVPKSLFVASCLFEVVQEEERVFLGTVRFVRVTCPLALLKRRADTCERQRLPSSSSPGSQVSQQTDCPNNRVLYQGDSFHLVNYS